MITTEGLAYLTPNLAAILLTLALCIRCWKSQSLPGHKELAFALIAELLWMCGHIGKLTSPTLEGKIIWDDIEFLGTCAWPMATFAFALKFSGARLPRILHAGLWILPLFIAGAALTDPWTAYLHPNARLVNTTPFTGLLYDFKLILSVTFLQILLQVTLAAVLIIARSFWLTTSQRVQSMILSAGILLPVIGSLLILLGIQFTEHRDTSHITFGVGNVLIYFGLFGISKEAEHRFSTLFDNASDAILIMNGLMIIDCNIKAQIIFQASKEKLVGTSVIDACAPVQEERACEPLWRANVEAAMSGQPQFFGWTFVRKTGEEFDAEVSLTCTQVGPDMLLQAFVRDRSEIRAAALERESLIRDLRAKNMELERFNYSVSHDLKSPLITIKGFVGMLAQDVEKQNYANVPNHIHRISSAADKMYSLLEDLLALSRAGKATSAPALNEMDEILDESLGALEGLIQSRSAEIIRKERLPLIFADAMRMKAVWQNLIENSIKYARHGVPPKIQIGCKADAQGYAFYVQDNGQGIDPRYQVQVFGQFHKLDASTEGSGIGLSLVQRIMEAHQGRAWVESDGVGRGATFWFHLPRTPKASDG